SSFIIAEPGSALSLVLLSLSGSALSPGLLVWCGAAEGFSDKLVELGQNVTLDCEVSVKNVYWYLMKPNEPPVLILLSHSSVSTLATYGNHPALNRTFSLQLNSSLFIANVTENELGIYYCALNETPPKFSTGTRLQPTSESFSDRLDRTEGNQTCGRCPDVAVSDQQILLTVSGLVNCVLLVVVTGELFTSPISSANTANCERRSDQQYPLIHQLRTAVSKRPSGGRVRVLVPSTPPHRSESAAERRSEELLLLIIYSSDGPELI
ncbi:hypothetical protein NFI96_023751, partial [Prochilodus magdalenae]